jgi:hypothetical protein
MLVAVVVVMKTLVYLAELAEQAVQVVEVQVLLILKQQKVELLTQVVAEVVLVEQQAFQAQAAVV